MKIILLLFSRIGFAGPIEAENIRQLDLKTTWNEREYQQMISPENCLLTNSEAVEIPLSNIREIEIKSAMLHIGEKPKKRYENAKK